MITTEPPYFSFLRPVLERGTQSDGAAGSRESQGVDDSPAAGVPGSLGAVDKSAAVRSATPSVRAATTTATLVYNLPGLSVDSRQQGWLQANARLKQQTQMQDIRSTERNLQGYLHEWMIK